MRIRCSLSLHRAFVALLLLVPVLALPAGAAAQPAKAPALTLRKGDRIAVVGNTLADRMQHDGWLETYLQTRFPQLDLSFRHLGFSADEVPLNLRLRSQSFGTPDEWLTRTKADVVFAFFGANESHAGKAGLEQFRADLDGFIKHTLAQKYNGRTAPRLVLFAPIAHENLKNRNLPDGKDNNKRRALYTTAMAEVARANGVPFIDLFHSSQALYGKASRPLTINGIHLNERGNEAIAEAIDRQLFAGQPEPQRDTQRMEKIRQAVLDRNFHWFNRYRTVDGYSIYGGRADLRFVGGQTNRVVMQREMEILDAMTANRDKRVWAVARGGELKIDDSNTPAFIPVVTNKPGKGPGGAHLFLGGEEAIKYMKVGKNLKVNLFASEEKFPELANPVQMQFDPKGRLWAAVWPTYPHWKPKEPMNDKLLVFEDTDGDGKADKMTVFADGLHCPTGFDFYNGGVLIAQAPDLVFLKDTDGDGKADVRERVLSGLDSADTHHTANSFVLDPGGALYFQEGVFHHTQVETPWGAPTRNVNAGVYRYEPRTHKFEAYVNYGFANPHGHVFDRWGQDFVVDGTGANPYHAALFSSKLDWPRRHKGPPQLYRQKTRPCPGLEVLSSKHFPDDWQGDLLVANVIGFHGILRYQVNDKGASFEGVEEEPLLSSTDQNFRPSDLRVGPDGAIYFLDWHNPIIGHMQHNLRDPSRDRTHGRIYRVTYTGRPLSPKAKIAGEPIENLLALLTHAEDRVRSRARIELGARDSEAVVAAAKKWAAGLDTKAPEYAHHLTEALWVHQYHNVVDADLLRRVLALPDFRARAAATRVLCYWRDRVPGSLELLKKLAADAHPRVRLEAVRAASFYTVPEAVEVALVSAEHPTDPYLDFVRAETMRGLEPYVKLAITKNRPIPFTTRAGARYFVKSVSTPDLLRMKRSPGVYVELLSRPGIRDEFRNEAVAALAKAEKKGPTQVLLDSIAAAGANSAEETVLFDLVRLLTARPEGELKKARPRLETMASAGPSPLARQLGYVALIAADGDIERAWTLGTKSLRALQDLVSAMPLIRDPNQRAALYPKVAPLLTGLPSTLAPKTPTGKATLGRFVRIELPGPQRTLTLAEVEVFSAGVNAARRGKARQSSTAHNGSAQRAIDGNKNGSYGAGGQTHTQEGQKNPWWEVDLGGEQPIESITIWNRTDGNLGSRLRGFTLKVLDGSRNVVFEKKNIPAPAQKVALEVGGSGPEHAVRRAAMLALTSVRGKEGETFTALTKHLKDNADRAAAVQALLRIPSGRYPKDQARPTLETLLGHIRKVPVAQRTTPAALDALQLADTLAALLPLKDARAVRKELGELGVRVLRLGTVADQMLFDKERLVVKAGRPVEIRFENTDLMPHNFVIVRPGALEEIGTLAEATGAEPSAMARGYVPVSPKVMHASRLLQPRDAQALRFDAPTAPGVYPYVCTYPGHWRRMYGALYVVADLDEYLADPEGYLKKVKLPIRDELLKNIRPRREWKFEELASSIEHLAPGRSFAHGKRMFQIATCVACHKLNGVGTELGPDLSKLDAKLRPVDILKDVLEPSHKINEKFQSYVIETNSGKVITGLIVEETAKAIKVIENPLVKSAPLVIPASEVAAKTKSPTSIMPKGLLDTLTREEVLDLLAYVIARGEARHPLFQGAGHDHHEKKRAGGHGH